MTEKTLSIAQGFYTAMGNKNVKDMEKHLHPNVQFMAPLATANGKEAYLEALKGFTSYFNTLTIRAAFGSKDQAMVVYDVDFPAPVGKCPTAVHLTFEDELITKIQLFYDGRLFEKK